MAALPNDCRCSVKSIFTAAAFTPALKSAIVIEVNANTKATFGRSSRKSLSSRIASTFLNPFLLLAIRISLRFKSCSVTNWSLTISYRVTLTSICIVPVLLATNSIRPPICTRLLDFNLALSWRLIFRVID